jgi:surfeit locus 1 family protein
VDAEHDAYRHVQLQGVYVKDAETLVQSATTLGLGYWVMTPLKTDQGFVALVNRGFIPSAMRDTIMSDRDLSSGEITVTGLLRITEPDGRFMLPNQPSDNRWYSRDVAAIGATHNLSPLAPYFIDVDAENMNSESWPRGGMTVVQFPDSHLMYALTWFGLALMLCGFAAKEFYFSSSKSDKPK